MLRNIICATMLIASLGIMAQPTAYDAEKLSNHDLNGTARFVGMGGAMSALGGDISTMATNPAGTAMYRSSDIMLTFGVDNVNANLGGSKESRTRARLNNLGIVLPFPEDMGSLLNINLGVQYQKRNNFYKNMSLTSMMQYGVSQLAQVAFMADGTPFELLDNGYNDYNPFYNEHVGWLPIMGFNTGIIRPFNGHEYEYMVLDEGYAKSTFSSTERGGIDETDINLSLNFNNRVYLGFTLNLQNIDYTKNTYYMEDDDINGYEIYSDNNINGDGVGFKAGVIVRPIEESSLRFGLAIHTPTYYRMTLTTGFDAFPYDENGLVEEDVLSSYDEYNCDGPMEHDFRLLTPWVFNVSAGYTAGTVLALGAEYEYENFQGCSIKDINGYTYDYAETAINNQLNGMHTLRLGGELKVSPQTSLRLGYNYNSAVYNKDSYKMHASNSINTDTEFANRYGANTYTAGIGYRFNNGVYLDAAYKYRTQDSDFYAFCDYNYNNVLKPISLKETTHSFMATLGYRF